MWSRQAGVVLERHGLTVVPNVRWILPTDYDMIARGIPQRSVIAVSNYGSRRDPLLRKRFDEGLPAMIERLAPEVVLVYGSTRPRVFTSLKNRTEFIEYRPKTATEPITRQSFRGWSRCSTYRHGDYGPGHLKQVTHHFPARSARR